MQCNIDQRGRRARLVSGAVVDGVGAITLGAGVWTGQWLIIMAGAVISFAGLFMIFEGLKGWCVLRALGVKTPL